MEDIYKKNSEGISSLRIITSIIEGYEKFIFEGKLIYGNTQVAKQQIQDNLQDSKSYILDMSKLEYIDSTGLGLIMNFAKQVYKMNKNIVIILDDEFIKELFTIAKFHTVFSIVDNEKQALEVLQKGLNTCFDLNSY